MDKLTRREIRYVCFRLQTEADGGAVALVADSGPMLFVHEIEAHMMKQDGFDNWANFAKTWDVGALAPLVVVIRNMGIQSEWAEVLKAEAKPWPLS